MVNAFYAKKSAEQFADFFLLVRFIIITIQQKSEKTIKYCNFLFTFVEK